MQLRFLSFRYGLPHVTEHTQVANSVINFYTTSLSKYVGEAYQPPSLSYLANLWFQGSSELIRIIFTSYISLTGPSDELRQAIRTVFDASISSMSDEEAISTLEHWQHYGTCFHLDYLLQIEGIFTSPLSPITCRARILNSCFITIRLWLHCRRKVQFHLSSVRCFCSPATFVHP